MERLAARLERLAPLRGTEFEELLDMAQARMAKTFAKGTNDSLFNPAFAWGARSHSWLRMAVELGVRITKERIALDSYFDAIPMESDFLKFIAELPESEFGTSA